VSEWVGECGSGTCSLNPGLSIASEESDTCRHKRVMPWCGVESSAIIVSE
jgi:hypothetical protein